MEGDSTVMTSGPFDETRPLLEPLTFASENYCAQDQSALFNLPGEIRDRIFSFALAPFEAEDEQSRYEVKSYYARPDYFAPQRFATKLLQTCQRAYHEAWFRLWTSSQHTIWLTSQERAPPSFITVERLANTISMIRFRHGDAITLEHFRVFAQLWALESSERLQVYLDIPNFLPRQITITIRHTDCWWWEYDSKLCIRSAWTKDNIFPNSLQVLRIDLESLERKKEQVDNLVKQMKTQWYFTRKDNIHLFASDHADDNEISKWQGSSTLNNERWVRDEQTPGKLDYYIRTATWRADPKRSVANWRSIPDMLSYDGSQEPITGVRDRLYANDLRVAGIEDNVSADETVRRYDEWRAVQQSAYMSRVREAMRRRQRDNAE